MLIISFPAGVNLEAAKSFTRAIVNDEALIGILCKAWRTDEDFYIRKGKDKTSYPEYGNGSMSFYNYEFKKLKHTFIRFNDSNFVGVI